MDFELETSILTLREFMWGGPLLKTIITILSLRGFTFHTIDRKGPMIDLSL